MAISLNPNLNSIFSISDPEIIAETIHNELNFIINDLAPASIRQMSKSQAPWLNNEIRNEIRQNNDKLTLAINTNMPSNWLNFRQHRNSTFQKIEAAKKQYLSDGYANNKQKWKQINNVIKQSNNITPKQIVINGKVIRKPREIAEIANLHYINKIAEIRDKF